MYLLFKSDEHSSSNNIISIGVNNTKTNMDILNTMGFKFDLCPGMKELHKKIKTHGIKLFYDCSYPANGRFLCGYSYANSDIDEAIENGQVELDKMYEDYLIRKLSGI